MSRRPVFHVYSPMQALEMISIVQDDADLLEELLEEALPLLEGPPCEAREALEVALTAALDRLP